MSAAPRRTIGVGSATALVVASMIGTGVYTTTGLLLGAGRSLWGVVAIWVVAGVLSLAGALSYAELAVVYPESGGEYSLLGRLYHPAVGFVAGVVSLVLGFAAPIAACAIAFARYSAAVFPGLPEIPVAIAVVVGISSFQGGFARIAVRAQDTLTAGKLGLALLFVIAGSFSAALDPSRLTSQPFTLGELGQPGFAYGVVLVSFAYTGWNAAIYISGELAEPARALPRALAIGTVSVTLLYVAINVLFLLSAPVEELRVLEVAHVAARHLFGPFAANVLSLVIAFGLLSTIGAFVLTGTRVYGALGRDHPRLAVFVPPTGGAPRAALVVQSMLAIAMIATSSFDTLLGSVGVTLSLSSALAVLGVFVVRRRGLHAGYRTPAHPLTTLAFVGLSLWTIGASILEQPRVVLWGSLALALGALGYMSVRRRDASPHRG